MKELYDDKDRYTEDGNVVRKELEGVIDPIFVRLFKEGYRARDIQNMFEEVARMSAIWCRAGMHSSDEELTED